MGGAEFVHAGGLTGRSTSILPLLKFFCFSSPQEEEEEERRGRHLLCCRSHLRGRERERERERETAKGVGHTERGAFG